MDLSIASLFNQIFAVSEAGRKVEHTPAVVTLCLFLLSSTTLSHAHGYYVGWADVVTTNRELEVKCKPIDCNVCSVTVILPLPKASEVLIAQFQIPELASGDDIEKLRPGIAAQKTELLVQGEVRRAQSPVTLHFVNGGSIDVSPNVSFRLSNLKLLSNRTAEELVNLGYFEKVQLSNPERTTADPMLALESFIVSKIDRGSPGQFDKTTNKRVVPKSAGFHHQYPTLAQAWSTNTASISRLCHLLLFYGLGPTDLSAFPSGMFALSSLTDEEKAIRVFGESPFIRTRKGLRYRLAEAGPFDNHLGESHRDQCLATFAALNLPLETPIHANTRAYCISDLLNESIANFSFDQHEPAWTAMAYAKYLPPKKEWVNRFREAISFSTLVHHLLQLNRKSQSCAGTHIFQALLQISDADNRYSILDTKTRRQLDSYRTTTISELVRRQMDDGSWDKDWAGDEGQGDSNSVEYRILVTGHLLEVLNALPSNQRPPKPVYTRAAEWLERSLTSAEIRTDPSLICPLTHAVRGMRAVLEFAPGEGEQRHATQAFRPAE